MHSKIDNWLNKHFCQKRFCPKTNIIEIPSYPRVYGVYPTAIEDIILQNIEALKKENKVSTDDIIDYISPKTNLNDHKTMLRFIISGDFYDYHPIDVLNVLKYTAEYFNTTLDYLLGLTDKPY